MIRNTLPATAVAPVVPTLRFNTLRASDLHCPGQLPTPLPAFVMFLRFLRDFVQFMHVLCFVFWLIEFFHYFFLFFD
jgi:hypothetical protein